MHFKHADKTGKHEVQAHTDDAEYTIETPLAHHSFKLCVCMCKHAVCKYKPDGMHDRAFSGRVT